MNKTKQDLLKFINSIPELLKTADTYWEKDKKTGRFEHSLECTEHGMILHSSWFQTDDEWKDKVEHVKFCHYCGKPLVLKTEEIIQNNIGHGNLQLLIWDEVFRQQIVDEINGKPKQKDEVPKTPQQQGAETNTDGKDQNASPANDTEVLPPSPTEGA